MGGPDFWKRKGFGACDDADGCGSHPSPSANQEGGNDRLRGAGPARRHIGMHPKLEELRLILGRADRQKAKTFKDKPRHDWASHSADAFRYMAMAYKEIVPDPSPKTVKWKFLHEATLDELWEAQDPRRRALSDSDARQIRAALNAKTGSHCHRRVSRLHPERRAALPGDRTPTRLRINSTESRMCSRSVASSISR